MWLSIDTPEAVQMGTISGICHPLPYHVRIYPSLVVEQEEAPIRMKWLGILPTMLLMLCPGISQAQTYADAKRMLYNDVYRTDDERVTIYCGFKFDAHRRIKLPDGFVIAAYPDRANRAETEHVVPCENFGRAFPEWREGSPLCVDTCGNPFKGRKCAELANEEFRQMEADLHNLYPSVGSVNAARKNYNFEELGAIHRTIWPHVPNEATGKEGRTA